jgi:hypothetical protein
LLHVGQECRRHRFCCPCHRHRPCRRVVILAINTIILAVVTVVLAIVDVAAVAINVAVAVTPAISYAAVM